mmetsp:Transcript_45424/g.83068  ORF Transcript_45424/g.83068 Transcript_45424/m.83068 type:complete len:404 (-) Transcript_45424:34-1245(-)
MAIDGLRVGWFVTLSLVFVVVAVRPGEDASAGQRGRLASGGSDAMEALIEMAMQPDKTAGSQADPVETSLLMSEQLSHVIAALTEEHKGAQAQLLSDKVRMRQIDQQLAEDEALLKMLDEQIKKLEEGRAESIRDSKATLAIATHDRHRDQQLGYEALQNPTEASQEPSDGLLGSTSKHPVDYERADDNVIDSSDDIEFEGSDGVSHDLVPRGIKEESSEGRSSRTPTTDGATGPHIDELPVQHGGKEDSDSYFDVPPGHITRSTRRSELEGSSNNTDKNLSPYDDEEAIIQKTLKDEIQSLSRESRKDEDPNVGGLLQVQEQIKFDGSDERQEVLLQRVRQQVAEAESSIERHTAEKDVLQESMEDYDAIVSASEVQIADLLRTRDEVATAMAAAGHATAAD